MFQESPPSKKIRCEKETIEPEPHDPNTDAGSPKTGATRGVDEESDKSPDAIGLINAFLSRYSELPNDQCNQLMMFHNLIDIFNSLLQFPGDLGDFCIDHEETNSVIKNLAEIYDFFSKCEGALTSIYDYTYHLDRSFDDAIFLSRRSVNIDTNNFILNHVAKLVCGNKYGQCLLNNVRDMLQMFHSRHTELCRYHDGKKSVTVGMLPADFKEFLARLEDVLHRFKYGEHSPKRLQELSLALGSL